MTAEGQKPLLDGLPISEFVCIGKLVIGLRYGGFCEHHPAPWPSLTVGKSECQPERKTSPSGFQALCMSLSWCHWPSFLWSIFQDTLLREDPCKDADLVMFLPSAIPSMIPHPLSPPCTAMKTLPGLAVSLLHFLPFPASGASRVLALIAVQPILETEWKRTPRKYIKFNYDLWCLAGFDFSMCLLPVFPTVL